MKEESLYSRKGESAGTIGTVIMLVTGVGVAVLVLIFVGALSGQTYQLVEPDIDAIGNHALTGESTTALLETNVSLVHSPLHSGTFTLENSTGFPLRNATDFILDETHGQYELLNATFNNTGLLANYTWGNSEIGVSVKASVISSFEALEQTGDYMPIIVLAVVITLVLGLILGMLMFRGRGSGGSSAL